VWHNGGGAAMLFGGGGSLVMVDEGWRRWFWKEVMWRDDASAVVLFV